MSNLNVSNQQYVIKLDNGHGEVEYFLSWSLRAQAYDKKSARKYPSPEAAASTVDACNHCADAFSGVFIDPDTGRYALTATVELA